MTEYYVNADGDDRHAGTRAAPWRTLARASRAELGPGDRLYLKGGQTFAGSLIFNQLRGTAARPIDIGSYGEGTARIAAAAAGAILLTNPAAVRVSNLKLFGFGYPANQTHGLCLYADGKTGGEDVRLEDLEIHGFGIAGVAIGASGNHGFKDVQVKRVHAHHNAYAGIFIWGGGLSTAHADVRITHCLAELNSGIPHLRQPSGLGIHSGHGILMTCVDQGLIENCRARDNGSLNTAHLCGPAGIWASNGRRITIRGNESYRNRTSSAADGGGFGLDGGVTDSVMEDNFAHDNDGPGFLLCQYYGARPFARNIVRRNRSQHDARRNDHGAIHVWGPFEEILSGLLIEGNQVVVSASPVGRPRALSIGGLTSGLRVLNNHFTAVGLDHVLEVLPRQRDLRVEGNLIQASGGGVRWQGRHFENVARWQDVVPQGRLAKMALGNHDVEGRGGLPGLP